MHISFRVMPSIHCTGTIASEAILLESRDKIALTNVLVVTILGFSTFSLSILAVAVMILDTAILIPPTLAYLPWFAKEIS